MVMEPERCVICKKVLRRKNKVKVCYLCGDKRVYTLLKEGFKIVK